MRFSRQEPVTFFFSVLSIPLRAVPFFFFFSKWYRRTWNRPFRSASIKPSPLFSRMWPAPAGFFSHPSPKCFHAAGESSNEHRDDYFCCGPRKVRCLMAGCQSQEEHQRCHRVSEQARSPPGARPVRKPRRCLNVQPSNPQSLKIAQSQHHAWPAESSKQRTWPFSKTPSPGNT